MLNKPTFIKRNIIQKQQPQNKEYNQSEFIINNSNNYDIKEIELQLEKNYDDIIEVVSEETEIQEDDLFKNRVNVLSQQILTKNDKDTTPTTNIQQNIKKPKRKKLNLQQTLYDLINFIITNIKPLITILSVSLVGILAYLVYKFNITPTLIKSFIIKTIDNFIITRTTLQLELPVMIVALIVVLMAAFFIIINILTYSLRLFRSKH